MEVLVPAYILKHCSFENGCPFNGQVCGSGMPTCLSNVQKASDEKNVKWNSVTKIHRYNNELPDILPVWTWQEIAAIKSIFHSVEKAHNQPYQLSGVS